MIPDEAEFCMQIDSHMDFYPNWDDEMINMWKEIDNEYAVLTTYVNDVETYDQEVNGRGVNQRHEVPHLCMVTFNGQGGMVRNWGTKCAINLNKPKLTNAIWGAGLSFSKCHAERKTPYDPNLPFVFDGEEFSKASRLWTYGYDMYTPHRVFVFHDYHTSQTDSNHFSWSRNQFSTEEMRKKSNLRKGNSNANNPVKKDVPWKSGFAGVPASPVFVHTLSGSHSRLRSLLEMPESSKHSSMNDSAKASLTLKTQYHRFGLGDRRSLSQLIEFSGVNTRALSGGRDPKFCGNLQYVPFTQHPLGAYHIPTFDQYGRPLEDQMKVVYIFNMMQQQYIRIAAREEANVAKEMKSKNPKTVVQVSAVAQLKPKFAQ